jgi:hypothetical protein
LDANLDVAPFDSISNPNRSVTGENNPRGGGGGSLNQRRPVVPINGGVGQPSARPEMDSFYMDRNDVRTKQ